MENRKDYASGRFNHRLKNEFRKYQNETKGGKFSRFTVCQDNSICPGIHLNYTRNKYGNSDKLVCFVSRNLLLVSTAKDLLEMLVRYTYFHICRQVPSYYARYYYVSPIACGLARARMRQFYHGRDGGDGNVGTSMLELGISGFTVPFRSFRSVWDVSFLSQYKYGRTRRGFQTYFIILFPKRQERVASTQNLCAVYGNEALNERQGQNWFAKFRSGKIIESIWRMTDRRNQMEEIGSKKKGRKRCDCCKETKIFQISDIFCDRNIKNGHLQNRIIFYNITISINYQNRMEIVTIRIHGVEMYLLSIK
ncbi:transposase [Vespula squamosa]|uniref:Transposase n=1 Tax=Vespula squamosa TaxID=30214 RepID=A0ABD2B3S4_VESSQ